MVSKPALRSLGAVLDFENSVLQLKRIGADVRLKEGPTGHYLLDLFQFPALLVSEGIEKGEQEIFPDGPVDDSDTVDDSGNTLVVADTEAVQASPVQELLAAAPTLRCWTRVDDNCLTLRATRLDGPPWSSVRERDPRCRHWRDSRSKAEHHGLDSTTTTGPDRSSASPRDPPPLRSSRHC